MKSLSPCGWEVIAPRWPKNALFYTPRSLKNTVKCETFPTSEHLPLKGARPPSRVKKRTIYTAKIAKPTKIKAKANKKAG